MRAAGYTLAAIANQTGVSVRTLSRLFAHCSTNVEPISDEMIQCARNRMLESVDSSERIREAVASSIEDSIALTRTLREKVALALDVINIDNHDQAREAARALAQLASALKASQSVYCSVFGDEEASPAKPTILEIREMNAGEVRLAQEAANEVRHTDVEETSEALDVHDVA